MQQITFFFFLGNDDALIDVGQGYVCFAISIVWIGFLTALIGDVASHFGCSVNMKDSVTAIGFVAMGTSLPGIDGHISCNHFVFKEPY